MIKIQNVIDIILSRNWCLCISVGPSCVEYCTDHLSLMFVISCLKRAERDKRNELMEKVTVATTPGEVGNIITAMKSKKEVCNLTTYLYSGSMLTLI